MTKHPPNTLSLENIQASKNTARKPRPPRALRLRGASTYASALVDVVVSFDTTGSMYPCLTCDDNFLYEVAEMTDDAG